TAPAASAFTCRNLTFHAAFYMDAPPEKVYQTVKGHLMDVLAQIKEEGIVVSVRPEVMGRDTQFGSVEELLRLSKELKGVSLCIDFAHLHARAGVFNTHPEFVALLKKVETVLGRSALEDIAIHVSGIEYTKRGEKKHLNLKQSDFNYPDFVRSLKDCDVRGMVICESPNLEEDALLLQREYLAL
ncbi:MAG: TIM barrel protein, partial [Dehalococcoidia bacterium]|nr:TIM barrel protein [Dehalococcoidia bacterium]